MWWFFCLYIKRLRRWESGGRFNGSVSRCLERQWLLARLRMVAGLLLGLPIRRRNKQTAAGMADLSYWCYLFTRWKTMGVVLKSAAMLVQPWISRQLSSS